jgi:hypothetical protein
VTETEKVSETEAETELETAEEVKLIKQVLHATIYSDDKNTIEDKKTQSEITLEGLLPENGKVKVHAVELGVPEEETYSAYQITIYDKDGNAYRPEKGNKIKVIIDDPAFRKIAEEEERKATEAKLKAATETEFLTLNGICTTAYSLMPL